MSADMYQSRGVGFVKHLQLFTRIIVANDDALWREFELSAHEEKAESCGERPEW